MQNYPHLYFLSKTRQIPAHSVFLDHSLEVPFWPLELCMLQFHHRPQTCKQISTDCVCECEWVSEIMKSLLNIPRTLPHELPSLCRVLDLERWCLDQGWNTPRTRIKWLGCVSPGGPPGLDEKPWVALHTRSFLLGLTKPIFTRHVDRLASYSLFHSSKWK